MISASDELILLVKKWINESIEVGVLSIIKGPSGRRAMLYVEGVPHLEETTKCFGVRNKGSFAAIIPTDSQFGYIRFEDKPELLMTDEIMDEDWIQLSRYEEAVLIGWPEGSNAIIVTLKK
ncbi:MAG TPA: hypothetical protein VFK06_10435 [Candidatus Angelobacter sp.]|nr:hypothetical protein [Candidatus Angelobacter sp.]